MLFVASSFWSIICFCLLLILPITLASRALLLRRLVRKKKTQRVGSSTSKTSGWTREKEKKSDIYYWSIVVACILCAIVAEFNSLRSHLIILAFDFMTILSVSTKAKQLRDSNEWLTWQCLTSFLSLFLSCWASLLFKKIKYTREYTLQKKRNENRMSSSSYVPLPSHVLFSMRKSCFNKCRLLWSCLFQDPCECRF
jgi:hypothetical protein